MNARERKLKGPEKAIAFLLSIGEERAAKIVRFLDEGEIRVLAETLESMRSVSNSQIEQVYLDFGESSGDYALALGTGAKTLHRMAVDVLGPEKANDLLMREIEAPEPLHILNRIEAETLAGLLGKEHPQSLAALLAHADVGKAAAVLKYLSKDLQSDVVRRMASLEAIPHTTIEEAERALREELALVSEAKVAPIDGVKRAAELIAKLDSETSERLLEEIDQSNEELCLSIKRAMFTFEDLARVANRDMQTVLREVSSEQLKFAMKTATAELRQHILSAMSKRAAEMLADELAGMGPVKLSTVEEAQSAIVEVALKLQQEGKITVSGGSGEDMV
jgi:flagellar motor switch protein FliG